MKRTPHSPMRAVLTLGFALTLAGLTFFTVSTPATHAYFWFNSPTISASSPAASTITVSGRNFTQGGTVLVLVTSPQGIHESTWNTTATFRSCNQYTGLCTMGGQIALTGYTQGCDGNGYFTLQAYDYSSHAYSNRVSVWVYAGLCIP